MMVELWSRKREMGDEDEHNMEDTSGYDKSGEWLDSFSLEHLVSVLLPARSGLVLPVSGKVKGLAHEIL